MKNKINYLAEKFCLFTLSVSLFLGLLNVHRERSREGAKLTVRKNAFRADLTLEQIEEILREERRFSINEATREDLTVIPGIGPALADRIVSERERRGDFLTLEHVLNVKGVGPAKLKSIEEYVHFGEDGY